MADPKPHHHRHYNRKRAIDICTRRDGRERRHDPGTTGPACEVAPPVGASPCWVPANEAQGEEEGEKEGGEKRKREPSGERGTEGGRRDSGREKDTKKRGGVRREGAGLGLPHRNLPVKRSTSHKLTKQRNRMKGGAGFCNELERYRRLAFGPALGTRSMTRWRDTSASDYTQDKQTPQGQNTHTPRTQEQEGSPDSTVGPTHRGRFEDLYVKGELIGHGGYGSVYAGFRKTDSQPVALKFVDQRKITMWAKMRPIPCLDLFNYMQEGSGYLEEGMARHVMQQVVSALLHCHSRGVVHRDLKPENILVQLTNHNVLLLDFGSASVLKEGEYTDVAGTPEYLPPETVLRGEYFAVPATVWSLGILLFQMVWGDVPFYSDTSIAKATLYFPRGISRDCRHLIRRCLAVSPDDRPTLEQLQQHPWMQ
ncbi:hypothetical protein J4Q44_G00265610 [Coregonus suidteri]|uniref:non-specific serine/threonine protein kinase n=1 Tax=Coregonus suidteri TaxID=861788 RepID=A0AAN8LJV3_9TELE